MSYIVIKYWFYYNFIKFLLKTVTTMLYATINIYSDILISRVVRVNQS